MRQNILQKSLMLVLVSTCLVISQSKKSSKQCYKELEEIRCDIECQLELLQVCYPEKNTFSSTGVYSKIECISEFDLDEITIPENLFENLDFDGEDLIDGELFLDGEFDMKLKSQTDGEEFFYDIEDFGDLFDDVSVTGVNGESILETSSKSQKKSPEVTCIQSFEQILRNQQAKNVMQKKNQCQAILFKECFDMDTDLDIDLSNISSIYLVFNAFLVTILSITIFL